MTFQPPVSGEHDPFDKYRVSEIIKDKSARDATEGDEKYEVPQGHAFLAYVSLIFKKLLDIFEETTERGLAVSAENDVREHLVLLKAAMETLKIEDRSQDSAFLNHVSLLWHHLLEAVLRFRRQTPFAIKMRSFIKEFQNYPEKLQHSLGYYLTEYAGQKWLPFPFMEIVHRLYSEHKKAPESSHLVRWSKELDEMIQSLKPPETK
jgi:hypothetical protein